MKVTQPSMDNRFLEQQRQYEFPYHHIPHYKEDGVPSCVRSLTWGFEYLVSRLQIEQIIRGLQPASALEIGCGDGVMIGQLDFIERRVGCDLAPEAIRFANAFFPNVDYRNIDVADVEGTFDVALAVEVLEHVPTPQVTPFLQAVSERVAPGGHFVLSLPTINIPLKTKHYRHYTLDLLDREMAEADVPFTRIAGYYYYRPTRLEALYRKLMNNRLWEGEFKFLRRRMWAFIQKRAIPATEADARHLIAVYQKKGHVA